MIKMDKINWDEIGLNNDFLFAKVMRDKDICKEVLEKLLQTKIHDIVYLEEQKAIDIQKDAKSIRLDVYLEDGDRVFNVEMQVAYQHELAKRARYYQSMIDLNTIEKGESYRKLKESYVIFICMFDPFGKGNAQYSFENICLEEETLKLKDGTHKIFFNAPAYGASENADIRDFLKYVNGESGSKNPFVKKIEEKVRSVKESKEWRLEYMTLYEREQDIREESLELGLQQGLQQGRQEGIKAMIAALKAIKAPEPAIVEQLVKLYRLTQEQAKEYLRQ